MNRILLYSLLAICLGNSACVSTSDTSNNASKYTFEKKLLFIDNNEACEIADYNKDGHLDISAGRNWYAGPDFKPRPLRSIERFGPDYIQNNGEHALDVNGDGWLDIIGGKFTEPGLYWYENPKKNGLEQGKLWKQHKFGDTDTANETTHLVDFDNDGKPEYIANCWQGHKPQLIWKFVKNGKRHTIKKSIVGKKNGHGIGFGDINGDGRMDIAFQQGWYEQPESNPLGQEWEYHKDWFYKEASCEMIIVDLNEDGRNDLIYGDSHDYGLFWMEQLEPKGEKTQWKRHEIDMTFSQSHALGWFDLDGDGDKELITGKRVRGHSGSDPGAKETPIVYCFEWNKETQKFERHTLAEGVSIGLYIKHADLDKDGRIDIVLAGKGGTHILFNRSK